MSQLITHINCSSIDNLLSTVYIYLREESVIKIDGNVLVFHICPAVLSLAKSSSTSATLIPASLTGGSSTETTSI